MGITDWIRPDRHTILCSATYKKEVQEVSHNLMLQPIIKIRVGPGLGQDVDEKLKKAAFLGKEEAERHARAGKIPQMVHICEETEKSKKKTWKKKKKKKKKKK